MIIYGITERYYGLLQIILCFDSIIHVYYLRVTYDNGGNTPLSTKKQRFLQFIRDFSATHGIAPSFQEIISGLQLRSLGTVNWYVHELEKEGYLRRSRGRNGKRALELTGDDPVAESRRTTLPLLGTIAAGLPIEAIEVPESIEVPRSYLSPENYVLRVKGDSMIDDHIQDGDYVIIRQGDSANAGQTVVALINGEATLKRYYPCSGGIELQARNPDYPVIHVQAGDDFRLQGILLYVFRIYE